MAAVCKSCHAEVLWVRTPAGRSMPVDPEPHEMGTVMVEGRHGTPLARADLEAVRTSGVALYRSHFATCSHADEHRHKRPPAAPELDL